MRYANSNADCKSISNGDSYIYAYPDSPGHSYTNSASYGYTYRHNVGNAFADAYVPAEFVQCADSVC
jgi:hypothetical protein